MVTYDTVLHHELRRENGYPVCLHAGMFSYTDDDLAQFALADWNQMFSDWNGGSLASTGDPRYWLMVASELAKRQGFMSNEKATE